jgi:hypothetical protein
MSFVGSLAALVIGLLLVSGCGPRGPALYDLSGQVTHNGKPIPEGEITIEPDAAKNNTGPQAVAKIKAGRYATEEGMGIVGGPSVVRISGFDGVPVGESSVGTPLFDQYETQVDLPKQDGTKDFDVPAAQE